MAAVSAVMGNLTSDGGVLHALAAQRPHSGDR